MTEYHYTVQSPGENSRILKKLLNVVCEASPLIIPALAFSHVATYAFADDYFHLFQILSRKATWLDNRMLQEGRPFYGFILIGLIKVLGSTSNLFWLRLFGVAGVTLTTVSLSKGAELVFGLDRKLAGPLACALTLTPTMGVYAFYASTAPYAWATALATGAGFISYSACASSALRTPKLLLASVFVLCCELIYQPAAGFFLVPIALGITCNPSSEKLRASVGALLHYAALISIYFGGYLLFREALFPDNTFTSRGGSLSLFWPNLENFFLADFALILPHWAIFCPFPWNHSATFLALAGLIIWCIRTNRKDNGNLVWVTILTWIGALLLSAAPLLGSNGYSAFRTLSASQSVLWAPSTLALLQWIASRTSRVSLSLLAILGLLVISARVSTNRFVISPLVQEYETLSKVLCDVGRQLPPVFTATALSPLSNVPPGAVPDFEYGSYSASGQGWQLSNMIPVLLAEQLGVEAGSAQYHILVAFTHVEYAPPQSSEPINGHGILIDLPLLLGQTRDATLRDDRSVPALQISDPLFGKVSRLPSGWVQVPNFGTMLPGPGIWIYHEDLGWLKIARWTPPTFAVRSPSLGLLSGSMKKPGLFWMEYHDRFLDLEAFTNSRQNDDGYAAQLLHGLSSD